MSAGGGVREVLGRDLASAARFASEIGQGRPLSISDASFDCDLLVLAVPDDAIESAAAETRGPGFLSRRLPPLRRPSRRPSLARFESSGAAVGSLHPLEGVSRRPAESWKDAFVAVEGDRRRSTPALRDRLGSGRARLGRSRREEQSLFIMRRRLWRRVAAWLSSRWRRSDVDEPGITGRGGPRRPRRPRITKLSPLSSSSGFEEAFTGPISRRDVGTVRDHGAALARVPPTFSPFTAFSPRDPIARTTRPRTARSGLRAVLGRRGTEGMSADFEPHLAVGEAGYRLARMLKFSGIPVEQADNRGYGLLQLRHDADGGQDRLLRSWPVREDHEPPPHLRAHVPRLPRRDGVARDGDRPDALLSTSCRSTSASSAGSRRACSSTRCPARSSTTRLASSS